MNHLAGYLLLASMASAGATFAACSDSDSASASSVAAGAIDAGIDSASRIVYQSPDGGRPSATICAIHDGGSAGSVALEAGVACADDADCTASLGGRCVQSFSGFDAGREQYIAACVYDQCSRDSDCAGKRAACGCGASSYSSNLCLINSNCRIDSDCDAGQRCALSDPAGTSQFDSVVVTTGKETGAEPLSPNFQVGYFCTTPVDRCSVTDVNYGGSGNPYCVFDPNTQSWDWIHLGAH